MTMTIPELLAAAVTGRPVAFDGADASGLVAQARREGLVPLLARGVRARAGDGWPAAVRDQLDAAFSDQVALEHLQRLEIVRLLAGLADAGVRPLLMKGAALAYTVYPDPVLRPHDDIDLLICEADRDRAAGALASLGYVEIAEGGGALSFSQAHFGITDRFGIRHTCDLHWRIVNPVAFRDMVAFDELDAAAVAVPRLSPHARTFAPGHALFVSCVHRIAHHLDGDVLVWIYDIHLLVQAAGETEMARFEALATRSGACAVCARGLDAAARYFGTTVPPPVSRALAAGAARGELSAAFLRADLRPVDLLRSDLAALGGWRARLALVAEHLFPTAQYMREAYAPGSRWPLPCLYAYRIARGSRKWFRAVGGVQSQPEAAPGDGSGSFAAVERDRRDQRE